MPSGPFVCVELYFKLQIVFYFQWLVCSSYLFTFDSVLMGYMFLETCPSFLGCQICCHIIVHGILFCSFCISVVSIVISSLSFFILFICVFCLFFLMSLARAFSILFTLSNNQLLVLLIFFQLTFKISISSLIFIISFLLLILNFGCYFSNSFVWWVRLFIWDFSYFLKTACFAINFPLRTAFAASHRFSMVRFHCHLPQSIFKFLLRFTIDPLAFLVACLFSLHVIVVGFLFFFLISFSVVDV